MAIDREKVLDTALRLIDEVGLDGLSLRRLAKELGVQAPALYWHFSSKQDLLDHVAVAARKRAGYLARRKPAPGQTWDDWLAEDMRHQRRAMLAHRDGARLVAGNRPVRESLPGIENTIGVLVDAGFSADDAVRAMIVVGHYVSGFVLDEQHSAERAEATPEIDPGEFPLIHAAGPAALERDTLFEYGLRCLLDGMRAQVRTGSGPGDQPSPGTRAQP